MVLWFDRLAWCLFWLVPVGSCFGQPPTTKTAVSFGACWALLACSLIGACWALLGSVGLLVPVRMPVYRPDPTSIQDLEIRPFAWSTIRYFPIHTAEFSDLEIPDQDPDPF